MEIASNASQFGPRPPHAAVACGFGWVAKIWMFAILASICLAITIATSAAESAPKLIEGVILTVRSGNASDWSIVQGVALYVPAGESASPFVPPGAFTAIWDAQVAVDLRSDFTFQAITSGALRVEVNGVPALESAGGSPERVAGKPIRLNKGLNAFKVTFTSPPKGDSILRLYWGSDDFAAEPVSPSVFRFASTPQLENAARLHEGRELFLEFRCARCHAPENSSRMAPELRADAPTFEGIGSRLNTAWMSQWIANPASLRASARMPALLHGPSSGDEARAIAEYLSTLKELGSNEPKPPDSSGETIAAGKKHFATLLCAACHQDPGSTEMTPAKISLNAVNEKFSAGALSRFLRNPAAHYQWTRMPDFHLTAEESEALSGFLESSAPLKKEIPSSASASFDAGQKLVQTRGCLNCHALKIENQFASPALTAINPESRHRGCLAPAPADAAQARKTPRFIFNDAQRAALSAFLATDRSSIQRHVVTEFATRQSRLLNCKECHGKHDGFPSMAFLGGKLKPEWTRRFLAGEISSKPRPWIEPRMPAFKVWAEGLAAGLASSHGFPASTPVEPKPDPEFVKAGLQLVSSDGGFSCISCHGVGSMAATQVFESTGINLALSGDRLQAEYFTRWLSNPLRMDPQTKMPAYFDQGKSPLTELFEGDAAKQINAIWKYILLGTNMPLPAATPADEPAM